MRTTNWKIFKYKMDILNRSFYNDCNKLQKMKESYKRTLLEILRLKRKNKIRKVFN
jgi:hypothetical protein